MLHSSPFSVLYFPTFCVCVLKWYTTMWNIGNEIPRKGALYCRSFWCHETFFAVYISLKRKSCHFDDIVITGCTDSCQNDNSRLSQWRKCRQNDNLSVPMKVHRFGKMSKNKLEDVNFLIFQLDCTNHTYISAKGRAYHTIPGNKPQMCKLLSES